jgi:hypothetical protein
LIYPGWYFPGSSLISKNHHAGICPTGQIFKKGSTLPADGKNDRKRKRKK